MSGNRWRDCGEADKMDYQAKDTKYLLPDSAYRRTLATIRDYYRMKSMIDAILYESPAPPDGMPRGSAISNPTARQAERLEEYVGDIRKIDQALTTIPQVYQRGVWENVMFRTPYPQDGGVRTYARYKSQFIIAVAKNFGYVLDTE